jgi:hypothetical protein
MIDQVGKYIIVIENNSISVTPITGARVQRIQKATFNEIYSLRPKYVRDYCYIKTKHVGWIYLIHFDEPYKHAKHYLGFTKNLDLRMLRHASGTGARLMQVVEDAGIDWRISRVWFGDRYLERQLKGHSSTRYCPICQAKERVR